MSGHTSRCRRRYSSMRSCRTFSRKQIRCTGASWVRAVGPGRGAEPPGTGPGSDRGSEVELVDVGGVEDGRVAEQYDTLVADGEAAQVTGLEALARGTGD